MNQADPQNVSSALPMFGAPPEASLEWMEANVRLFELWFECQRNLWQPMADWQAAWMLQWMDPTNLPFVGAFMVRGQEQLG